MTTPYPVKEADHRLPSVSARESTQPTPRPPHPPDQPGPRFNVSIIATTKDHIPSRRDTRPPLTSRQNTPSGPITTKSASAQRFRMPGKADGMHHHIPIIEPGPQSRRHLPLGIKPCPRARERTSPSAQIGTRWTDRPPSPRGDPIEHPTPELTRRLRQRTRGQAARFIESTPRLPTQCRSGQHCTTTHDALLDKRRLQTTCLSHPDHAAKAAAESDDAV